MEVVWSDDWNESKLIKGPGIRSRVNRLTGCTDLGSNPGRRADPGGVKRTVSKSIKDLFFAIYQTFFLFSIFLSDSKERSSGFSLEIWWSGLWAPSCAAVLREDSPMTFELSRKLFTSCISISNLFSSNPKHLLQI